MRTRNLIFFLTLLFAFFSCKSYKQQQDELPDTPWRGAINVSADESFKPIVDELVQVYESNHSGTKINVQYKPEADCFRDLLTDSIRVVIATRQANPYERQQMLDSSKVGSSSMVVAKDAVALIVHPDEPESNFSYEELKQILTGKYKKKLIPVFDGVKATSTVRFIIDSVLHGDSLTKDAVAARSSKGVIEYISKTPGAVGFIGVSWIGNHDDSEQLSYLKEVKLVGIGSFYIPGQYVKPYQGDIYTGNYPLVRDLVYILKENYKGLGYGFTGFMSGEIGQLIFKRAYLVPAIMKNFGTRPARLKE